MNRRIKKKKEKYHNTEEYDRKGDATLLNKKHYKNLERSAQSYLKFYSKMHKINIVIINKCKARVVMDWKSKGYNIIIEKGDEGE